MGIVVSGEKITLVDVEASPKGPLTLQSDETWPLQKGDRAGAYKVMHGRVADYIRDHGIDLTVIKESAVGQQRVGKAHLSSAELRGVVMCAAASASAVKMWSRAATGRKMSRKGSRKVQDYVEDESYFASHITGSLKAGSREAALMLLEVRPTQ